MTVLELLRDERSRGYKGGLYHQTQVMFAYNSNHIEGTHLTAEQTRYIFETHSFFPEGDQPIAANDVVETLNHFTLFDYMLDHAEEPLTEEMIKEFHRILKTGTVDASQTWFKVGDYKTVQNGVGITRVATPKETPKRMAALMESYHQRNVHTVEELVDFHYQFESIHPFQDGNGRVGRMILFKECLKNGIMPFVILDENKAFYYRGLQNYPQEKGYLIDTCLSHQDRYRALYEHFCPQQERGSHKEPER